jgi:hypothetical protein
MKRKPSQGRAADARPFSSPAMAALSPYPDLPPHSDEEEQLVIGCVIDAGGSTSQNQVDAFLGRLSLGLFYVEEHRKAFECLVNLRAKGHAVDAMTSWSIGGLAREYVDRVVASIPSLGVFDNVLPHLQELAHRRWILRKAVELRELANAPAVTLDDTKARLAELYEATEKADRKGQPLIEVLTPEAIRQYQPDPSTYLVGEDMITRGDFSVLAGWQGLGKSMLSKNLAFAGARGGNWMGYPCKRKFRTFILQGEDNRKRLKAEFTAAPWVTSDHVRFTPPIPLAFGNPSFRAELRRYYDSWPFDLLIIDNWTDISGEQASSDAAEAFNQIRDCLPYGDQMPAVLILAHLRKQRGGDHWRPKMGRELMHELSGTLALTSKARTVFVIQPVDASDMDNQGIVFQCAKANNEQPIAPGAWTRAMGACTPIANFDLDAWMNPAEDNGARKVIREQHLAKIMPPGVRLTRKRAVEALEDEGFAQQTAYKALSADGKFADRIVTGSDGLLSWRHD